MDPVAVPAVVDATFEVLDELVRRNPLLAVMVQAVRVLAYANLDKIEEKVK